MSGRGLDVAAHSFTTGADGRGVQRAGNGLPQPLLGLGLGLGCCGGLGMKSARPARQVSRYKHGGTWDGRGFTLVCWVVPGAGRTFTQRQSSHLYRMCVGSGEYLWVFPPPRNPLFHMARRCRRALLRWLDGQDGIDLRQQALRPPIAPLVVMTIPFPMQPMHRASSS